MLNFASDSKFESEFSGVELDCELDELDKELVLNPEDDVVPDSVDDVGGVPVVVAVLGSGADSLKSAVRPKSSSSSKSVSAFGVISPVFAA